MPFDVNSFSDTLYSLLTTDPERSEAPVAPDASSYFNNQSTIESDYAEKERQWQSDGSGTLTLKELEKVLRRPMELDAKLKAGGAGAIELTAKNKNALRVKEDA